MVRILFWIVLIYAAIWFWRKFKSPARSGNRLDSPLQMVRCAQCGVHLPQDRALRRSNHWYCSQAHLEKGPSAQER